MNVKPILDKLYIQPIDPEEKTSGGIIIPDNAKEAPSRGRVMGVGTGRITRDGAVVPLVVREGDTVLFNRGAGHEVKVKNEKHLILSEDQVLAVVE